MRLRFSQRICWVLVLAGLLAIAQSMASAQQSSDLDPADLVREAVWNEVSSAHSGRRFQFQDEKKSARLWQTRLIIETREGTAGMLILQNGKPIDSQQRQAEESRLENYLRNPDQLSNKRKQEREDADRTERILRAMPDAFLYDADGTQPGSASLGHIGDTLVRLKFRPNPNYNPPSRVEEVLTGMSGHVLVDATEKRIAEIDGTLTKEVSFGWGILGHLDTGGRFVVQQADVGNHEWEITHMMLSFTGRVLFFKKIDIHSNDTYSDFRSVPPDLTFAQAVDMLKHEASEMEAKDSAAKAHGEASVRSRRTHNPS